MIIFFVAISIVAGFVISFYIFTKHISKLEILIKARDIQEAYKFTNKEAQKSEIVIPLIKPETLSDVVDGKSDAEIREIFKVTPQA